MTKTVTIQIDGKAVKIPEGTTIFNAAKEAGIEIPHFCYHPKLSIAGNCRLCQVEVEGAKGPVISCRERVRDGMVVRVQSDTARDVRKNVLEFILINHPLDCPICDQSGECKLQDQYFDHSLKPSQMTWPKVHKPKAKTIGPQVMLDDERCVLCTRCIRFCDEIVGEHQLILRERGDHSTIDVFPGKQLDNAYSLCTVDLCPVGALTSSDFRFKKRVWFLTSTPSICTGCATGCNIWLDHCDQKVYRYRPRENEAVNQCWMCDPGRMTYKAINSDERVLFPIVRNDGAYQRTSWFEAMARTQQLLAGVNPEGIVGIVSAEASLEENMGLIRFLKECGVTSFVWAGRSPEPQFVDKILRDADRNPNTHGVKMLTKTRFGKETKGQAFVVLGRLHGDDLTTLVSQKPKAVIAITDILPANEQWADVVLPRASHAEQEGHMVNRAGLLQKFERAFAPKGESAPGWQIAARLAGAWGKPLGFTSAREVFETEKQHYDVV
ncbi:MAG: (2Fe-2S)-binding protein [Deltaproteobacteria bacterium]|nr:(2Fe-2S)-binding protein [Deltaproteobacteria bacterium]